MEPVESPHSRCASVFEKTETVMDDTFLLPQASAFDSSEAFG